MANDASIYVFHADTKGLIFRRAFEDAGFYLSGVCQWVKQSLVLGRSPYHWKNEPCLLAGRRRVNINGMREDLRLLYGSLINLLKINSTAP